MKSLPTFPITFEEFLEWCDSETRAEWVNGKVVLLSPAASPHQRIVLFLAKVLGIYVEAHRLGEVVIAPFVMKVATSAREPDLFFVPRGLEGLIKDTFFDGPAPLVVEVVSPESVERDRVEKFAEYAAAGVNEYWIIDPEQKTAEFYGLRRGRQDRQYDSLPVTDGIFRSREVDGFFLRVDWLWRTPTPRALDVLQELGILERPPLSAGNDADR